MYFILIERYYHLGLNAKCSSRPTRDREPLFVTSFTHAESRGAVGVRAAGCQNPAEDQERGDSNSGASKAVLMNERNIHHHSEKFVIEQGIRLWFVALRCVNMLREVFHHWFYCFHLGLRSPFSLCQAGVIFPLLIGSRSPQSEFLGPQGPQYVNFLRYEGK